MRIAKSPRKRAAWSACPGHAEILAYAAAPAPGRRGLETLRVPMRRLSISVLLVLFASWLGPGCAAGQEAVAERVPVEPVRYALDLTVDYEEQAIGGTAAITVVNVTNQPVREVPLLLHRLLTVSDVRSGSGEPLEFRQGVVAFADAARMQVNDVRVALRGSLMPGERTELVVSYRGWLAGYVETGMLYVRDGVTEDFTIVRPDAFAYPVPAYPSWASIRATGLASYDYEARITVPARMVVANGGELIDRAAGDGVETWSYRNIRPAWRMDFAIAPYGVLEQDGLRVYYLPGDSAGAARLIGRAWGAKRLFTEWFGPLEEAGGFAVIELPEGFGSQADVTSILQTAPAFRDAARYGELYHEIAHSWHVSEGPGAPRWEEGLATFLQALAADVLDGTAGRDSAAAAHLAWIRQNFSERPEWAATPFADYGRKGLTRLSYRVGAVMFDVLHRVVGQDRFNAIVGGYYRAYRDGGASTDAFVRHAGETTGIDLNRFFEEWMYTTHWYELAGAGMDVENLAARYP